jgi:hypothetical protein
MRINKRRIDNPPQVYQPVGMALRATKGDENLARAHFFPRYIDATTRWDVARLEGA